MKNAGCVEKMMQVCAVAIPAVRARAAAAAARDGVSACANIARNPAASAQFSPIVTLNAKASRHGRQAHVGDQR
jgi:hypothetical protein